MSRKFSILLVVAAMAAFLGVMPASADIIIYQDTFTGDGAVHGTTPDVTLGLYGGTAGATWVAGAGWTKSGGIATIGAEADAYLPFVPQAGWIYTLSADVDGISAGNFIGLMFARGPGMLTGVGWWICRDPDNSYVYHGPGTTDPLYGPFSHAGGVQTYSVILDTRPASPSNWTYTCKLGGTTCVPATAFGFDPAITQVKMYGLASAGSVDNFKLTVIPEPSTLALLATGLIGLLCYAWRKRK
ncbi:MAG: PEP-CTERM sorting domain-containing protein [Planctomycetales bacterium]|nr:PEP-CTERM sorting domain-containing protein [Planctomycetales bacterium]